MSFRCDSCHKAQPVHSTPHTVVVATRDKVYPVRRKSIDDNHSVVIDNGGKGKEIAKELHVCNSCYVQMK